MSRDRCYWLRAIMLEMGEICPGVWKIWHTGVAGQEEIFETQS